MAILVGVTAGARNTTATPLVIRRGPAIDAPFALGTDANRATGWGWWQSRFLTTELSSIKLMRVFELRQIARVCR